MDSKKPIIITSIILGVLIIVLVVVFTVRSCNKVDDLLPTSTSTSETQGSGDITTTTSGNGETSAALPDNTLPTSPTGGNNDPDVDPPFPTADDGEVIVTEAPDGGNSNPTSKPSNPSSPASPTTKAPAAPTSSGPIELPFVPADQL